MIDLKGICDALAARFAPGTIATPTGAVAMRASYAQIPKNVPTVPCVVIDVQDGTLIANPGQWRHEIAIDVVFLLAKRPGDPARVDEQRQRWLGTLLAATEAQLKIGLAAATGYSVDKAIPIGWEFTEFPVGADSYDAIRIHFTVYATENVSLTP